MKSESSRISEVSNIVGKTKKPFPKMLGDINCNIVKNPNYKIKDEELERLRSHIVKTARPMQAIRLLEKQRREREAEEEYQRELEEIIERAEKIEIDTQLYIEDQQKKIEEVEHKKITITDCTNKKTLEKRRFEQEEKDINRKHEEINKLEIQKEYLNNLQQRLSNGIKKFKGFDEFLKKAIESSTEEIDKNPEGLMKRYEKLKSSETHLTDTIKKLDDETEALKFTHGKEIKNIQDVILTKNSELHRLQQKIELMDRERMAYEQNFEQNIKTKMDKTRNLSAVVFAIDNIYRKALKDTKYGEKKLINEMKKEKIKKEDEDAQIYNFRSLKIKLDTIKVRITDLKNVFKKLADDPAFPSRDLDDRTVTMGGTLLDGPATQYTSKKGKTSMTNKPKKLK